MLMTSSDVEAYIHRATGELAVITSMELQLVEDDMDPEDLPDWQQKALLDTQRVLYGEDFLKLPGSWDIDEHHIMRDFAISRPATRESNQLQHALRGSGAFRRFKETVANLGLRDEWFEYRDMVVAELAREWLERQKIAYADDVPHFED